MAHNKKKNDQQTDKMDKLIDLVAWLATEVKNMKQELNEVKSWNIQPQVEIIPEVISAEDMEYQKKFQWWLWWSVEVKRETPYKVIPIESIVRDESYLDPSRQWIKKIYRWIGKTFPNKKLATEYLEAAQKRNPGQQYDIFPV